MDELKDQLEKLAAQNESLFRQNVELQARLAEEPSRAGPSSPSSVAQQPSPVPAAFGVRPKLAPFWFDRPAGWFAHIEAQFALSAITQDETKYNYVVSQIDSRLSRDVEDLITNPAPLGQRYNWIKAEMIKRFSASEAQRIRQLISGEELGDRKPSVFLRHLRSLSGNLTDETILRELFLQRLPRTVQAILTAQAELSLKKIAELADKILEVSPASTGIVCATAPPASSNNELDSIIAQLQALSKQVAALSARRRSRSRSSPRRPSPRSRIAAPDGLCWYHSRYQGKAIKCVRPCSWSGPIPENQGSSQR